MLSLAVNFFRNSNRKFAVIFICSVITIYTIFDTSSYSIASPLLAPHGSLDNTEVIIPPPTSPLQLHPCDPNSYSSNTLERALLSPQSQGESPWWPENRRQFGALCHCLHTNTCVSNQDQVVILAVHYFQTWYSNDLGAHGGESIWATSILESLRLLNYTFLYVEDLDELAEFYRSLSTNVISVIISSDHIMECWHDTERCVKSPQNPLGVPIWKIFSFCFWQIPVHPLGHHWTIAPENYATKDNTENVNTYVGYSVEPSCNSQAIIPHAERPRGGVYAMTKCVSYLAPQHLRAWPPSFYERAAHELGIHFTIGAINASDPQRCGGTDEHLELPQLSEYGGEEVMTNLGILERPVFMHEVAKSRVLLGVGRPWISPTPYQALCLGVPFINPIVEWDTSRPHDRAYWNTQHNGLRDLDPPYVYNVHKNDEAGFVKALSQAMKQPIGRYLPPGRSLVEVAERLHAILRKDWRHEAENLLGERIRTKQGEKFTI